MLREKCGIESLVLLLRHIVCPLLGKSCLTVKPFKMAVTLVIFAVLSSCLLARAGWSEKRKEERLILQQIKLPCRVNSQMQDY